MSDPEPEETLTSLEFQLLKETRLNAPFRAAFEHSPIGFALLSVDGYFLETNAALERLLGYTRDEFLTTKLERLAHPDDRLIDAAEYQAALNGMMEHYQVEKRYMRKSGGLVHVLLNVSLIRSDMDEPAYFVAQLVDLSAQKRLLSDLQRANEELQNFAGVISHDLKAPLRGIHTMLQWLRDDHASQLEPAGRELIDKLMERSQQMDAMINAILEYARLGSPTDDRAEIDLNALVHDIVEMIVPRNQFDVIISPSLPSLHANPFRLQQVFQNLIDNAVKFNDKPRGIIRIGAERVGEMWRFWVQDNGIGIPKAQQQRIFDLFHKAHGTRSFSGSGLGLAIVKRIIETEGGQISVSSDQLTTFTFTLPAGKPHESVVGG
ncbi:MAG: ATP-binding protein [Anaerolinea sp.]